MIIFGKCFNKSFNTGVYLRNRTEMRFETHDFNSDHKCIKELASIYAEKLPIDAGERLNNSDSYSFKFYLKI